MPCGCEGEEKEGSVKLRFIGGRHKKGRERGPYLSYETGKIYEVSRATYASVPWWEEVTKKEIKEEFVPIDEDAPSKSGGLTRGFKPGPMSPADFVLAKNDEQLKRFIEENGGEVDGRWGRKKLESEALTLL